MNALLVFLGGGLGALCRYGLARLLPPAALTEGQFPWATFLANLLACIILGVALGLMTRDQLSRSGQLLLVTGFCGGFSTFSTFAAELTELLQGGHAGVALLYLGGSLLLGIISIGAVVYLTSAPI
ncbi:fluoride efflux transporter CrcB [Neolewinella litorea]|uniref:Fluoride-specific ion channel FluC n=1 Tax=Neolewinella litorea TaxID=2562452 RepID=A0A4V6S252_9BACT|nr:fluoride efflux transporter CrcB [Neolewinella litorea]THH39853.1 fluoride efflux transporter CrcB [Neolewinella litorea]